MSGDSAMIEHDISALAVRMAQEVGVNFETAERAVRNLLAKGFIKLKACNDID